MIASLEGGVCLLLRHQPCWETYSEEREEGRKPDGARLQKEVGMNGALIIYAGLLVESGCFNRYEGAERLRHVNDSSPNMKGHKCYLDQRAQFDKSFATRRRSTFRKGQTAAKCRELQICIAS